MKHNRFALFAVLSMVTTASAGPILLASLDNRVFGPGRAPADPRVEFVLEISGAAGVVQLGRGVFWEQGDTGSVVLGPETDPAFELFSTSRHERSR